MPRTLLPLPLPLPASAVIALALAAGAARAADVVVRIDGVASTQGQVGCALFDAAAAGAFPMGIATARGVWLPPVAGPMTCRFADVAPGRYAVSVAHDLNANQRIDTNFLGMPTEPWGVSNNVHPALRAPRFDEAAFVVDAAKDTVLEVQLAK